MHHKGAHIITVGNEKGGSGKSTITMNLAIGLLRLGYKVGTVDLDSHQATLTSYMKNRWNHIADGGYDVPSPEHIHIEHANGDNVPDNYEKEQWRVETAVRELASYNDFVVIDTPGNNMFMNLIGHSVADTLITPINDSLVDLDVLVKLDKHSFAMKGPSTYARMVEDMKVRRTLRMQEPLNWFVMVNRTNLHRKEDEYTVQDVVKRLQYEMDFIMAPSFSDRMIFRELFLKGLTMLDLKEGPDNVLNMGNINARQEVRNLVRMILPQKGVSTLSLLKTV